MSKKGYFLSLLLCFFSMACSECLAQCRQWHSIAMHSLFLWNISRYLCCQWESSIGSKAPMKSLSSSTRDVVHIVTSMPWIPRACRRFYALCILRGSHRLICFQVKPLSLWIFGPCKSTAVPASTAHRPWLFIFLHSTSFYIKTAQRFLRVHSLARWWDSCWMHCSNSEDLRFKCPFSLGSRNCKCHRTFRFSFEHRTCVQCAWHAPWDILACLLLKYLLPQVHVFGRKRVVTWEIAFALRHIFVCFAKHLGPYTHGYKHMTERKTHTDSESPGRIRRSTTCSEQWLLLRLVQSTHGFGVLPSWPIRSDLKKGILQGSLVCKGCRALSSPSVQF